jgi:hypothetical protein
MLGSCIVRSIIKFLLFVFCLNSCSSSSIIKKVSFDNIKKIKNKDYIIVAFSGYQKSTDIRFEAELTSYSAVEKIINDHCKKKGKNTYKTTHSYEYVKYTYGNGIEAWGQRFWCAKNFNEAKNLYINYLKNPPDIYLSRSQIKFKKDSIKWIKKGRPDIIERDLVYYFERSGLSLYKKNSIEIKPKKNTVKNKKKDNSNLIRE